MLSVILKYGPQLLNWMATKAKENLPKPNLVGDRDVEWSWVLSRLRNGSGKVLDFGCGASLLGFIAAQKGYNVTAIDLEPIHRSYAHPNMSLIRGDILKAPFQNSTFDLIINCSSIEHVGLAGRYGSDDKPEGDIEAMSIMRGLLKPEGVMLLTIPVGVDALFSSLHRIYGRKRLPRLLDGWIIKEEQYWIKDDQNRWVIAKKQVALTEKPTSYYYGLGCFVLKE